VKYKLIILVMCSSSPKFKKLEKSIKETWANYSHPGIRVIFYTDNARTIFKKKAPVLKGDNLVLPCQDGYLQCTEKTLQAFEYIAANFNFEYIFRTNLGSYVNLDKMAAFLNDKPKTNFYSGIVGTYTNDGKTIRFASGSGYFLSKDLVDLVVAEREKLDQQVIDDLALGKFMAGHQIPVNEQAIRLSQTNNSEEYQVGCDTVSTVDPAYIYHVRLRSDNRDTDIKRMHNLFNSKF